MKKRVRIYLVIVLLATLLEAGRAYTAAAAMLYKPHVDSITMAPSSYPVDSAIQTAALSVIQAAPPDIDSPYYAITNVMQNNEYYMISVAAVMSTTWHINDDNTTWLGHMLVYHDVISNTWAGSFPGTITYTTYLEHFPTIGEASRASLDPLNTQYARYRAVSSESPIFPWQGGTIARYGYLGIHDSGFYGYPPVTADYKGIDFVSDGSGDMYPNMIYAAASGAVSFVCRDETSMAMMVGDYIYCHLVDNGAQSGDYYSQAEPIGPLLPGPSNDDCGYAPNQAPDTYHLHFGFPTSSGYLQLENYTLDVSAQTWDDGSGGTINIGGFLTASGAAGGGGGGGGGGIPDTPTDNLWGLILSGITSVLTWLVYGLMPTHNQMGIASAVTNITSTSLGVLFTLFFSQINPTLPLISLLFVGISEGVRSGYAFWRTILKIIPLAN